MLNKILSLFFMIFSTNTVLAINLEKEEEQLSYSLGCVAGEHIKAQEKIGININSDTFIQGFKDTINNKQQLNQEQIIKALNIMRNKQSEEQKKYLKKTSEINLKKGKEFLEKNKKTAGIVELKNGLQYQIINSGDPSSKSPNINDQVAVQYRGTLLDGTEFDSSYDKPEPAVFPLKSLIKGWQEALLLMKPKDKWKIFVPPQLAYGAEGAGHIIGPNAVLVFDIELVSVNPA